MKGKKLHFLREGHSAHFNQQCCTINIEAEKQFLILWLYSKKMIKGEGLEVCIFEFDEFIGIEKG